MTSYKVGASARGSIFALFIFVLTAGTAFRNALTDIDPDYSWRGSIDMLGVFDRRI